MTDHDVTVTGLVVAAIALLVSTVGAVIQVRQHRLAESLSHERLFVSEYFEEATFEDGHPPPTLVQVQVNLHNTGTVPVWVRKLELLMSDKSDGRQARRVEYEQYQPRLLSGDEGRYLVPMDELAKILPHEGWLTGVTVTINDGREITKLSGKAYYWNATYLRVFRERL